MSGILEKVGLLDLSFDKGYVNIPIPTYSIISFLLGYFNLQSVINWGGRVEWTHRGCVGAWMGSPAHIGLTAAS